MRSQNSMERKLTLQQEMGVLCSTDDNLDTATPPPLPNPASTLVLVRESLEDDKAEEIIEISLENKTAIADHMVIASGRSARHVSTCAEKLVERLKHQAGIAAKIEGAEFGDWVLIDAGDVIVHLFRPEVREFYDLERMWQGSEIARRASE